MATGCVFCEFRSLRCISALVYVPAASTSSLAYYPNSVAGFRLLRLLSCGYISPNPGPAPNCNKNVFSVCRRRVAHNHRAIPCDLCLC